MTPRYNRLVWGIIALCLVFIVPTQAQIVPYPYSTPTSEAQSVRWMVSNGEVRRAYALLEQVIGQPSFTSVRDAIPFTSAEISRNSAQPTLADRTMEQFIRNRSNSPHIPYAWLERGLAALENDDLQSAEQFLTHSAESAALQMVERNDSNYSTLAHYALYWLGASQANQGKYEQGIATLRNCITAMPNGVYSEKALYCIGQIFEKNADPTQAIAAFAEVRKLYPTRSTMVASKIREAQNHLRKRQAERALDVLLGIDELISAARRGDTASLQPQMFIADAEQEVLFIRAQAASLRGKYQQTYDSCLVLLRDYPTSPYRWFVELQAGFSALSNGRADLAKGHLTSILSGVPDEASVVRQQALLYHAVALKMLGEKEEAEKAFETLAYQSGYPFQAQALVEVGISAYERGTYDKAEKAFERADKESRDALTSVRASVLLGAARIELQQFTKAAAAFERAELLAFNATEEHLINRKLYLAESRLKRGICLVMANQTKNAITALTDFIGNHPKDPRIDEATFWLAESMYHADLLKNAQELYEEVVNKYTASIRREEAMYGLAWTYFRRRDLAKSIDAFGDLLEAFPKSKFAVDGMVRRGDGFYISKQYKAASEQYKTAFKRSPSSSEGQYAGYQAGQALYRANDLQGALQHLRNFVVTQPMSKLADDALFLIGWIEFQQRNYQAAITEFRRLLAAYPSGDQAVRALYTLGDAMFNMEDVDGAMETYHQVIKRFPSHALASEAAKNMQIAYMGMGKTSDAIKIADDLINANPQSVVAEEFMFKKAEIFFSGRNYSNAASELEAYLKKYPSSGKADEAMYLLGKTFLTMNDDVQARAAFSSLEQKYPSSSFVVASKLDLAVFYNASANSTKADSLYAIVTTKFASDTASASRAGFERATIHRVAGDSSKALTIYKQVADRYPSTEYGDQARYQVASYYRRNKNYDSARIQLGILARTSTQPLIIANALYEMGEMFFREKNYAEALPMLMRVREEYAGYEDWYTFSLLTLGEIFELQLNFDAAKEAYGVIVELRPEDDFGKTAASRLKRIAKVKK